MQQPSRITAPDRGASPLLARLIAKHQMEEREDLTQEFLRLLGMGETDGAQVAQELRAHVVGAASPQPIAGDPSREIQSRLGLSRARVNGYTVARRLRKQLKDQASPAA